METRQLIERLRYHEIPRHFRWDSSTCTWTRRAQAPRGGDVLGRLRHVKGTAGELYYLRLLLLHVPGAHATSWAMLQRQPPGGTDPTSQQYARELGLMHDDTETLAMLRDAVRTLPSNERLFKYL